MTKAPRRSAFDRGPRPLLRGQLHANAAWYFGGTSTALVVTAFTLAGFGWLSLATTLYALLLGTSTSSRTLVILSISWIAAIAAVVLNIVWITHPRWLSVSIYLLLGWICLADIGNLAAGLSTATLVLIATGGTVYTAGAISYALKRPNISERWFGFHEVFHAATIVAAGIHHVAVWLIVLGS